MNTLMEKGNDFLLRGAVKAQMAKHRITEGRDGERGDIVQTILIIALLLVIVIAVFAVLTPAIQGQGKNVGDCITKANTKAGCTTFNK